jgi:prepilin-type N-terminal cleavage/methylation domain-containing protein
MPTLAEERVDTDAGFSLIEVLVAVVLLAVLVLAIPAVVYLARRSSNIALRVEKYSEVQSELSLLKQKLSQAMPIYTAGSEGHLRLMFEGSSSRLLFVAPMAAGSGKGGLYTFEVTASQGGGLALRLYDTGDRTEQGEQRQLISADAKYVFRYFGGSADGSDPSWKDNWDEPDRLPDLVEIVQQGASADDSDRVAARVALRLKPPL